MSTRKRSSQREPKQDIGASMRNWEFIQRLDKRAMELLPAAPTLQQAYSVAWDSLVRASVRRPTAG